MPRVTVNLYATLRGYAAGAATVQAEIEPGETVETVLAGLGVPLDQTRIIFVNGRSAAASQPLEGGEQVGVFPAIGGG